MAKMEQDLKARELNRPIPQPRADAQPTFKVEVAAKLLPKLGADHELEVYLITFQKIANSITGLRNIGMLYFKLNSKAKLFVFLLNFLMILSKTLIGFKQLY